MTVKELIQELEQINPGYMVIVRGFVGGYCDAGSPSPCKIKPNVNSEWYYGPHEGAKPDDKDTIDAILI